MSREGRAFSCFPSTPCLLPQALPFASSALPAFASFSRLRPAHTRLFLRTSLLSPGRTHLPSLNKPPETSALQASRPAICHGFTLPADDRELSLQKLTCSSPPYEIMVTDDGRVHHRTDSLHPHLSRLSHGYWVAGGPVYHPELITSGRLQVKRRCPKPIATCVGGRGRSPERNTCVRSLFPLSRSFGSCSLL